jgi:hypothetical protein
VRDGPERDPALGSRDPEWAALQPVYVEQKPVEIRNGVFIQRLRTNV